MATPWSKARPRHRRLLLAAALLLPLVIAGSRLTAVDLWQDEANEIIIAEGGHTNTFDLLRRSEMRPPVRFYLLKAWLAVSRADLWLRGLSLFCLLAAVPLVWGIGRRLLGTRAAAFGTFLFAGAAYPLSTAWFVRSYSLDLLVALLAVWSGLRFRARPDGWRAACLAAACLVAAYTTYFALPVLGLLLAALALDAYRRRRGWRPLLLACGGIVLGYAPWLPVILAQHQNARLHAWQAYRPPLSAFAEAFVAYGLGRVKNWDLSGTLQIAVTLVLLGLAAWGWRCGRQRSNLLAVWFLVPIILLFLVSQLGPNLFIIRVMVGYVPPLYLLAGAGLAALPGRRLAVTLAAMLVALNVFYLASTDDLRSLTQGMRSATAHLQAAAARSGWPVVHGDQFTYFPFTVYGGGPSTIFGDTVPWNWGATQVPPGVLQNDLHFLDAAGRHAEGFYLVEKDSHYKERFDRWLHRRRSLAAAPFEAEGEPQRFGKVWVWTYRRSTAPLPAPEVRLAAALAAWQRHFPTDVYPRFAAGLQAQQAGAFQQAEAIYRHIITLEPRWPYAHLQLGLLLARQGRLSEALAALAEARRLDPENAQADALWRRVRDDLARRGGPPS